MAATKTLLDVFRGILPAALAAPLLVGVACCGGIAGGPAPDAGPASDTGPTPSDDGSTCSTGVVQFFGGSCPETDISFPCDLPLPPKGMTVALTVPQCQTYCDPFLDGGTATSCVADNYSSPPVIACTGPLCQTGRRPEGLEPCAVPREPAGSPVGRYFAEASRLEAASVVAFRVMERELSAHDAPHALVVQARRAARDEARHTRTMARLARRHAAIPMAARVRPGRTRSLEAIATENAVEGCVVETFGALLAWHQAAHAQDPEVASAMRRIAADETRHAGLAWAVHAWSLGRLEAKARARVDRAMHAAVKTLSSDLDAADPSLSRQVGLPGACDAHRFVNSLREVLWSR